MARKGRGQSKMKQRETRQKQLIFGSIIAVVVIIIGAVAFNYFTAPPEVEEARLKSLPTMGSDQPVVRVLEIGSYGCHVCRDVHGQRLVEDMLEQYGDQVQFAFQNFPLPGSYPNDPMVAEMAQCAFEQGNDSFWAMHDAIYDLTDQQYEDYDEDDFLDLGAEEGLDRDALESCVKDNTLKRAVDYWQKESQRVTSGTPTFYVDGQRLDNYTLLSSAVAQALDS